MATAPVPKMARTHFKARSGDPAPIRSLPSVAPPPAPSIVGVACPEVVWAWPAWRHSLWTHRKQGLRKRSRTPRSFSPPPRHAPAPFSRAGQGPASSARWLESQGLPCCESRPGSVLARSPAVLTRTARASLGPNHNHAQPQQHLLSRSVP